MTAPSVVLVAPSDGARLKSRDSITVRVTDADDDLRYHAIFAAFTGHGFAELVWDSNDPNLTTGYSVVRTSISGGYEYTLSRDGGWPTFRGRTASLKLRVRAYDVNVSGGGTDPATLSGAEFWGTASEAVDTGDPTYQITSLPNQVSGGTDATGGSLTRTNLPAPEFGATSANTYLTRTPTQAWADALTLTPSAYRYVSHVVRAHGSFGWIGTVSSSFGRYERFYVTPTTMYYDNRNQFSGVTYSQAYASNGDWHTYGLVYERYFGGGGSTTKTAYFYVDGVLIGSQVLASSISFSGTLTYRIGAASGVPTEILYAGSWATDQRSNMANIHETIGASAGAAPVVSLVSPPAGTRLTRTDPIVVEVSDDTNLAYHMIVALYPAGRHELVLDGGDPSLTTNYHWTRTAISGGWRYAVQRKGGWHAAPTLRVVGVDDGGQLG